MSTGTGGIGAEGAPSATDPQPPCNLHSCFDSVQLCTQKQSFSISIICEQASTVFIYLQNQLRSAQNKNINSSHFICKKEFTLNPI